MQIKLTNQYFFAIHLYFQSYAKFLCVLKLIGTCLSSYSTHTHIPHNIGFIGLLCTAMKAILTIVQNSILGTSYLHIYLLLIVLFIYSVLNSPIPTRLAIILLSHVNSWFSIFGEKLYYNIFQIQNTWRNKMKLLYKL